MIHVLSFTGTHEKKNEVQNVKESAYLELL